MNSAPTHSSSDGEYGSDPSKSSSSAGRSPLPDSNDASPQPTAGKKSSGQNNNNHNFQNYTDGLTFFKILVPSMAAGAIIGKGGETIAQLQQDTGTRIKMSKATDFFPGTNERVCIIYGANAEAILSVHDFIAQKIRDKPDPGAKSAIDYDTKQPAEREKQVKILVPNSTAGMIIGKAGNYIKHVKEESAAYVQISQKAKDHTITERCITVIGEAAQNRRACQLILNKIFEDPQSNSCPNLSYADVMGPVPNYNPTGSPFANVLAGVPSGPAAPGGPGGEMNPYHSAANLNQIFGTLRNTLRLSGFTEEATNEILAAMGTLASYGILGLGLGLGGLNVNMNMGYVSPVSGTTASVDSGYGNLHSTAPSSVNGGTSPGYGDGSSKSPLRFNGHHPHAHPPGAAADSVEMGGYGAAHALYEQQQQLSPGHLTDAGNAWSLGLQQQQQQRNAANLPRWGGGGGGGGAANGSRMASNGAGYPHQDTGMSMSGAGGGGGAGERTQCSIEINENLVGALLGREGKNVSEIEAMCGTSIQVTKKKFSAGRRSVVITGAPQQIQMTQMVIQQRLAQAEEKRALSHNHSHALAGDGGPPPSGAPLLSPASQFA